MERDRLIRAGWAAACLLVAGCGSDATGIGLGLVSEEQAVEMGQDAWRDLRAKTPPTADSGYQQRAERVSRRLLAADGQDPGAWEVVVFRGDQANAFALPGGKIGVYEGMMRLAETDDQLAAVIGHEIAHVDARHPSERLSSQVAADIGVDLAGALLGTGGIASPEAVAGLLGMGVQYGVLLPYSRNQELEADRLGLRTMAKAGYDPRAALDLWREMRSAGGGPPAFLSTHPAPDDRIQALEAAMPEAMDVYRKEGA